MARPVDRISEFLGCSKEDARNFCIEVQSAIGNPIPPFKVISNFLVSSKFENQDVETVAKSILEIGWEPKFKFKRSAKKRETQKKAGRSGTSFRFWDLSEKRSGSSSSGPQPGVESRSVFDKERLPLHEAKKCPHGVPTTSLCAICDPDKFREMTGIG